MEFLEKLQEILTPALVWFFIGIIWMLIEFAIPGLIVIFFGIGALVTAAVCVFFNIPLEIQLLIFIVTSIASLICLRKWLKTIFVGRLASHNTSDMTDDCIGQKVIVTRKITKDPGGKVELNGCNWKAIADEDIEEGAVVMVESKDNLTLKVKKT
jgi:membrane protein implicated in regulation of membrane protease activity